MRFVYTQKQLAAKSVSRETTYLLWNGLGGYSSVSAAFGAPRADQGILVAAVRSPNQRLSLVHFMQEAIALGGQTAYLSGQEYADGAAEDGLTWLQQFSVDLVPRWEYRFHEVSVTRQVAMAYGENTAAVLYQIQNDSHLPCTLELTPYLKFAPKETALETKKDFSLEGNRITCEGHCLYICTDGALDEIPPVWKELSYPEDAKDGRPEKGMAGACCRITCSIPAGGRTRLEIVYSTQQNPASGWDILDRQLQRLQSLPENTCFTDPIARQLVISADSYIANRDSTGGKTILAGYPLFSDWGRDTMIALPGCTLATGRFDDAKSILKTFLAYERDGLVPNLFPEGALEPMYNTVDAALLLIDCVWQYLQHTDDPEFLREAWPVMQRIIAAYRTGTIHNIGMDEDGLIYAGAGKDQVTWMDVCVQGILPTPRHGKPVEINAYWYNALQVMACLAPRIGADGSEYAALAEKVKKNFNEKYYVPDKGYLKDVLSDTDADLQIRCNQVWALSTSFPLLPILRQRRVLETVASHLLTDCGLRTLSPEDPQYHSFYGGDQLKRDMAYHQGTTWVFPLGAYYRACLQLGGTEVISRVKAQLKKLEPMLLQGCAGQLPEIYDGTDPKEGKGCFAQAWSVGEMLRVYAQIQQMENHNHG